MITGLLVLPEAYGAGSPQENCADLRTRGYELTVGWKDSFMMAGQPFNYYISGTLSDDETVITKFSGNARQQLSSLYEGKRVGDIWGYRTDGLFRTDEEAKEYTDKINHGKITENMPDGWKAGDLKILDINGDDEISAGAETLTDHGDLDVIGNSKPHYQYSINLGASWYGFDLSAFFQGIGKLDWYPPSDNRNFWFCYSRAGSTWIPENFMDNVWTTDNPDAYFPRPMAGDGKIMGYLKEKNDRYIQNIGYLRLKNLTLGYTLPSDIVKKAGLGRVRFYFSGENLFYLSPLKKYGKYIDPENAMANSNWLFSYPWQKTYSIGIDIDF